MTKNQIWLKAAPIAMLLVVALGAWMWYLRPEHALKWAVSMFMLPVAWCGLELLKRTGTWRATEADQLRLSRAITGAGLILAAALSLRLAETLDVLGGGISERAMGVVIGAVLVVCGNAIPKTLKPLAQEKCDPASEQALRRFAGWTFVLAGLGYAIAWLVVPLDWANLVATLIAAAALVLVATRLLRAVRPRKRIQPTAEL